MRAVLIKIIHLEHVPVVTHIHIISRIKMENIGIILSLGDGIGKIAKYVVLGQQADNVLTLITKD